MDATSTALVWFREDLRLHDHEPLTEALRSAESVVPVYCLDPRLWRETDFGWAKTGPRRIQFLLESLEDLRRQLQALGSNLVFCLQKPELALPALAAQLGADTVYATGYATTEEIAAQRRVREKLAEVGADLKLSYGHTLLHPADLPFSREQLPDIFTQFRKAVESRTRIRPTLPHPQVMPPLPSGLEVGVLPSLTDLGMQIPQSREGDYQVKGGETAGLAHWKQYLEERRPSSYKETRNGLLGMGYSSKLSAWLALGCLSPRRVYEDLKQYEAEYGANDSTYWLVFELLWRDYFHFVAMKFGSRLFRPGGLKDYDNRRLRRDADRLQGWMEGRTGQPFVDACMRQLVQTGFMSNRGRQNVASYLVHDLGQDWIVGAAFFEHHLIDYDPASNWANWCYVAGVGNDPRENRKFNVDKQARDYDPDGSFRQFYLPGFRLQGQLSLLS